MVWKDKYGGILGGSLGYMDEQLITRIPPIDDSVRKKINKLGNFDQIYGLIRSVNLTIEKFEEVLEEPNPKYKIKILEQPCEICYFYAGNHKECVYEKRCRERFNDMSFRDAQEIDKFAREEIKFCELLKTHIFQVADTLDEVRLGRRKKTN